MIRHRRRFLLTTLTLGASLAPLGGCSEPSGPGSTLRTRWLRAQQNGVAAIRPVVGDGTVYCATQDGWVVAHATSDGAERWRARISNGSPDGENMALAAGVLVVPVAFHTSGIDVGTGQVLWRYEAPNDTVDAGPNPGPGHVGRTRIVADSSTAYQPAWGASVSAIDLRTGVPRWIWQPGPTTSDTATSGVFGSGAEGVVLSGDTLYVSAWHFLDRAGLRSEPWLVALDRRTGQELWRYVAPSFSGGVLVWSGPVVHQRLVIQKGTGGQLWAVDRFTGQLAWKFQPVTTHASVTGPVIRDGVVYLDSGDDYITAVDASNGRVRWRTMTSNKGAAENVLATARRLYVPGGGNGLAVVDRRTGRLVAEARQPDAQYDNHIATPVAEVAPGVLVVGVMRATWAFLEP